jgi:hypothetical protein
LLGPRVEELVGRIERFETELAVLPRYATPLLRLLPLVPELAQLDEDALLVLQIETIALVLDTDEDRVIYTLREALRGVLGERFGLVAVRSTLARSVAWSSLRSTRARLFIRCSAANGSGRSHCRLVMNAFGCMER